MDQLSHIQPNWNTIKGPGFGGMNNNDGLYYSIVRELGVAIFYNDTNDGGNMEVIPLSQLETDDRSYSKEGPIFEGQHATKGRLREE